jgi:hypothetical protein
VHIPPAALIGFFCRAIGEYVAARLPLVGGCGLGFENIQLTSFRLSRMLYFVNVKRITPLRINFPTGNFH